MHRNVAGHLFYTSQCDAQAEALACTYIAVDRYSEEIQKVFLLTRGAAQSRIHSFG